MVKGWRVSCGELLSFLHGRRNGFLSRVDRALEKVAALGLDGLLLVQNERITKKNVRYLTGFTGSTAYVLVTPKRRILMTDLRYIDQASQQCAEFEIVMHDKPFTKTVRQFAKDLGLKRLGFETEGITVSMFNTIKEDIPDVDWVSTTNLIESLRAYKDEREISLISKACEMSDQVFQHILKFIKPGIREVDVALEFEIFARKLGAPGLAFDLILVSGKRTVQQHGAATNKVLEPGDFVVMDFGVVNEGYLCDMTRTVVVGRASEEQRRVYDAVRRAQELGTRLMKPGMVGKEVARLVTKVMADAGYEKWCTKGIGHGVGLEIHEEPFVGADTEFSLEVGHVLTVEPGIYIPGWGGVRIEDTVAIGEEGPRILTKSTKELIEVG